MCVNINGPADFDLLTLKLVCESHQRWGIFLPNLGTLGLWVLKFPMGRGIITCQYFCITCHSVSFVIIIVHYCRVGGSDFRRMLVIDF